jgi:hypothetical protein
MNRAKLISSMEQIKVLAQECLEQLGDSPKPKRLSKKLAPALHHSSSVSIDFDKPLRPFIKQHARGLAGPSKFVLLLGRLVKGDPKKEIALEEIQRHWNRMKAKSLLALAFNRFYPAQARENDWVETKKPGFYSLRPNWKQALEK